MDALVRVESADKDGADNRRPVRCNGPCCVLDVVVVVVVVVVVLLDAASDTKAAVVVTVCLFRIPSVMLLRFFDLVPFLLPLLLWLFLFLIMLGPFSMAFMVDKDGAFFILRTGDIGVDGDVAAFVLPVVLRAVSVFGAPMSLFLSVKSISLLPG